MKQFSLIVLALQIGNVLGNTEKAIFVAPTHVDIPVEHPTLEDLQLQILSPQYWSLRTHIEAEFPSKSSQYGKPSWYLLQNLREGQRYEVRICWAATQPTSFRMNTYDLPFVFEHTDLITSLARYSETRQPKLLHTEAEKPGQAKSATEPREHSSSTLFLQVFAAADYYTMNRTLMEDVPPVYVDIILDPYLFNIFPRSLVPTAIYIVVLAAGSWFLSFHISTFISNLTSLTASTDEKKE